MAALPTGTVTFLFTDIEGSTRLLQALGHDGYGRLQEDHAAIMRKAIAAGQGVEIRTEGDSFFAVFPSASGALRTAVVAQRELAEFPWPDDRRISVRMGLHTGEGILGGDDYLGVDVNRAARIAATGHGGQTVLSEAAKGLVDHALPDGVAIRDLGQHRLKDFEQPEHLHDLVIDDLAADFPSLRTLDVRRTNLPAQRTSFVGREREVAEIEDLLSHVRLLTLKGPGGIGKTRLASKIGGDMLERFADGVFLVDLSSVRDPTLVIPQIANALGVRDTPGRDLADGVHEYLRARSLLLVLDNLEQLVQASPVVADLLDAAPDVTILVTSRIALRIAGEHEYQVDPLALPDPGGSTHAEILSAFDSVRLFVERAAAVRPGFRTTDENAPVVAGIVARLDGLPLALELAASRLRVLSVEELAERLEQRLPLLTGGARDAPERHRTLEGAIRWSHELLDPAGQRLFAQLSVFSGGWTLDAAEAVGPDDLDVLDLLSGLVDDSLVRRSELPDGALRFMLLETIREYATERFGEATPDERDDVRRRHARFFRDLAEEAEPLLVGESQMEWLERLEREHENVRAALELAEGTGKGDDVENGLRTAAAIWRFWQQRGHLEEGRARLERLVALPAAERRDRVRARALVALGSVTYWLADYEAARVPYEESVDIAREVGEPGLLSLALFNMSYTAMIAGDIDAAEEFTYESLATAPEDDFHLRAQIWTSIGFSQLQRGRDDLGAEALERAIAMHRESGDRFALGESLIGLCGVKFLAGDMDQVRALLQEATDIAAGSEIPIAIKAVVFPHALMANHDGRYRRTATLLGAWSMIEEDYGVRFPNQAIVYFGDPEVEARAVMGDEAFERARTEGSAMTLDQVVELLTEASMSEPSR